VPESLQRIQANSVHMQLGLPRHGVGSASSLGRNHTFRADKKPCHRAGAIGGHASIRALVPRATYSEIFVLTRNDLRIHPEVSGVAISCCPQMQTGDDIMGRGTSFWDSQRDLRRLAHTIMTCSTVN